MREACTIGVGGTGSSARAEAGEGLPGSGFRPLPPLKQEFLPSFTSPKAPERLSEHLTSSPAPQPPSSEKGCPLCRETTRAAPSGCSRVGTDVSPQVCRVCAHSSRVMMPSPKGSACHFRQTTSRPHCVCVLWPTLPPPSPSATPKES